MYFIHLILLCVTFSGTLALQQVMLRVHECLMHIFTVTHSPVFTAAVLFTLCFLCLWEWIHQLSSALTLWYMPRILQVIFNDSYCQWEVEHRHSIQSAPSTCRRVSALMAPEIKRTVMGTMFQPHSVLCSIFTMVLKWNSMTLFFLFHFLNW